MKPAQPSLPFPDPRPVLAYIAVTEDGRRVIVRPSTGTTVPELWDVELQAPDGTRCALVGPFDESTALQRGRWMVTEEKGMRFDRVWVQPLVPWAPRQTRQDAPGSTTGTGPAHLAWPEPDVDYSQS